MCLRLLIIAIFLLLAQGLATAQRGDIAVRRSADGVEYPAATTAKRPLDLKVPLVGDALGALPEDVARRVLNSEKSKQALDGLVKKGSRLEWFATGIGGADVAMFRLTDGRVSLISLNFDRLPEARFKQIVDECEQFRERNVKDQWRSSKGVFVNCEIVRRGPAGAQFIAGLTPWNWYLLTHDVKPEVAEAIKTGKPAIGMTEQELRLAIAGEPTVVANPSSRQLVWESPKGGEFHVVAMGDDDVDPLAGFGKRMMMTDRQVTAEVKNGMVVGVRDEKIAAP